MSRERICGFVKGKETRIGAIWEWKYAGCIGYQEGQIGVQEEGWEGVMIP